MARLDKFLSTSSARRTTFGCTGQSAHSTISIHVLREEDDHIQRRSFEVPEQFLSTSSARRTTVGQLVGVARPIHISIHVLREEDDQTASRWVNEGINFYPRPPRGGRLFCFPPLVGAIKFLSTSSARRTTFTAINAPDALSFLSTSSARRTTITVW